MRRRWKETAGFTLVELIVVIAILGILAGVAVPTYSGYVKKANLAADQTLLDSINMAFASACIEEQVDIRTVSGAKLEIAEDGVLDLDDSTLVDDDVKAAFGRYLGGEVKFKVLKTDGIKFDSEIHMFVIADPNARITAEQVRDALNGTNFNNETALTNVMTAFDQAGYYFGEMEFSLDNLVADAPAEVQEAFGFGKFDLTDEQILEMYIDGYAAMSDSEKEEWKTANAGKIPTIRGNAYVMHMAKDAGKRNAAIIVGDVSNLMGALSTTVSERDVINYYNKLYDPDTNDYGIAKEALQLSSGAVSAETVVAVGTSGVKNTSGISTLGSMYALAAGYYNSGNYSGGTISAEKFADFDTVMQIMGDPGFSTYLTNGAAEKDIGAYLSAMSYLSQSDFDMSKGSLFSGDGLGALLGALGSN